MTTFFVPGHTQAKQRARTTRHVTYTPKATESFEAKVVLFAVESGITLIPRDTGVRLIVEVVAPRPGKPKRFYPPRGDWDNFGKAVGDALNKIAYEDDSQIIDGRITKRYAVGDENVGCHVSVTAIKPKGTTWHCKQRRRDD